MRNTLRVMSVAMILALVFGMFGTGSALASARDAQWVVSVTYQNVGDGPATIVVDFYSEGSATPVNFNPLGTGNQLAKGAAASFFIGSVSGLGTGSWRGSAVMSSDQPIVATVVQFSQQAGFSVRLLSNGFSASDASNQFLIPSVLFNRFNETTVFSVQNTETQDAKVTVSMVDASNGSVAATKTWVIPGGSSKYVEMDNPALTGLASGLTTFNGSATISAVLNSDGTTPAKVVAAASGLFTNKNIGANVEGVPSSRAANTLYMATALCRAFGMDTNYAVQNASQTDDASVTVTYKNLDGSTAGTDGPFTISKGQKRSFGACAVTGAGFSGAAVVTSTGAPIVALGKAAVSVASPKPDTANIYTAFLGEPAGSSKLSLPFIRWAADGDYLSSSNTGGAQRANIAIQNLEDTPVLVDVKYYGKDGGTAIATQTLTINGKSKGNSNANAAGALGQQGMKPNSFGYYTDGKFGGAVVVEANSANPTAKFIAIARVGIPGYAEDYNGVPVP